MTTLLQNGDRLCGIAKPLFRSLCENILAEGYSHKYVNVHGRIYGPFVIDETLAVDTRLPHHPTSNLTSSVETSSSQVSS